MSAATAPPFVIALTGGIATGKSSFARAFLEFAPEAAFFDCDACVHGLLTTRDVAATIAASLGSDLVDAAGALLRPRLRERVFEDAEARTILEGLLHPMVREACLAALAAAGASGSAPWFLMDVPLLYESGFPVPRDMELVVACGAETQRARLMARNGHAAALADRMVSAQLPIAEKVKRADVVVWNGGSPASLRRQTELLIPWLKNKRRP